MSVVVFYTTGSVSVLQGIFSQLHSTELHFFVQPVFVSCVFCQPVSLLLGSSFSFTPALLIYYPHLPAPSPCCVSAITASTTAWHTRVLELIKTTAAWHVDSTLCNNSIATASPSQSVTPAGCLLPPPCKFAEAMGRNWICFFELEEFATRKPFFWSSRN